MTPLYKSMSNGVENCSPQLLLSVTDFTQSAREDIDVII